MIYKFIISILFLLVITELVLSNRHTEDNQINQLFKRDINSSSTKDSSSTDLSKDDQSFKNKFIGQPSDFDDLYNSTLDNENEDEVSLFLDKDQLLIDGYQPIDDKKSFLIEELVQKLDKSAVSVKVKLNFDNPDQKLLIITHDRLVLKYELIKQSIFLDKSSKYYDYLNCFYVQYNPNFGLRSYLRSGFTFDFKKAYINTCFVNDTYIGKIYLTHEFKPFLKNLSRTVQLEYDHSINNYILKLDKNDNLKSLKDHQAINNLKNVYSTYAHIDSEYLNRSPNDQLDVMNKILNLNNLKNDNKIEFLNQLNSSLFHNGLHHKLNKFKFLKAQILFDSGLLTLQDKENFKVLNQLFQMIYESQNHFRQLNIYLVVVRLRFNLPNDLNILSNTDLRMDVNELISKIKNSNDDTYFELPADFKILFTSFKFFYQNATNFLPSFSHDLINTPESIAVLDFSFLKTNQWLLTYEIGHLLGIKDDNKECRCLNENCIMNGSQTNSNELIWSNCSLKQLVSNLKLFKFDFDLPIKRTEFNIDSFNQSVCGNGVLEPGELCDCGKFGCYFYDENKQVYQHNQCCNSTTCKLVEKTSQCASGSCCDLSSCKFRETGYVCRSSQDVCDIEEKCIGFTSLCPIDDYYSNGETCGSNR